MPDAVIIAGANGAGKTTFARAMLPVEHPGIAFLNADEIQREGPGFATPVAAGRELIRRLDALFAAREDFAIETTLSSLRYARASKAWRAAGYRVELHFIELPSADFAVERVAARVAAGGHGIFEDDVRRRFARGVALFATYKSAVDAWYHWFSDEKGLRLVQKDDPSVP